MKKCKKCGVEKDESQFFKKRERWFEGSCKECKKKRYQERVAKDPKKYREKIRLRSAQERLKPEWKEWRKEYQARKRKELNEKSCEYWNKTPNAREKAKEWRKNNRDKVNASINRHNKRNPFKHAARAFVCAAVKEGMLIRPSQCSRCFKEGKIEAHHEDYMKPLEIIWLCRSCHGKEHRKYKDEYDCGYTSGHDIHLHREKGEEADSISK
jgi:Bacillus phage endonuclease